MYTKDTVSENYIVLENC